MVLDTFYSQEEGQETFCSSLSQCHDFIDKQQDSHELYKIRPLTQKEYKHENELP